MKKIFSLIIIVFLAAAFTGCGKIENLCEQRLKCGVYQTDEQVDDCIIGLSAESEGIRVSGESACEKIIDEFDRSIECELKYDRCEKYIEEMGDCWKDYQEEWGELAKDGDTDRCRPYNKRGSMPGIGSVSSPPPVSGDDDDDDDDNDSGGGDAGGGDVDYYKLCDAECQNQDQIPYSECMELCCEQWGC